MSREFNQKIKLLRMMEILQMETDEEHPLTTRQICSRLEQDGIPCERRTITRDIDVLNKNGYAVKSGMKGHEKAYYLSEEHFTQDEICMIADTVSAAPFLTREKTQDLLHKLAVFCNRNSGKYTFDNIVCFDVHKTETAIQRDILNIAECAVRENRRITFLYYDIDEYGHFLARNGGVRFSEKPVSIIYSEGFYHLLCYDEKNKFSSYRIDRMADVKTEEVSEPACDIIPLPDSEDYKEKSLSIFCGSEEECILQFDESLIGRVLDRFSGKLKMERTGEHEIRAYVTTRTDTAFWGWLFGFSGMMQLVSPSELAVKYMTWCNIISQSIMESVLDST